MKPISDNTMTFDAEEKRYILTEEYVKEKTGIVLNTVLNTGMMTDTQKVSQIFLDQISEEIYTWIYSHNADNPIQEYFLATNEELRVILKKAMLEQVKFVLQSGDLFYYCGVNIKNGQVIEGGKLVENAISPLAKMKLSKQIESLGTSIIYQGKFRYPFKREDYV